MHESKDYGNLLAFLMPQIQQPYDSVQSKKSYYTFMKMQDHILLKATNKTLFQHYYEVCENGTEEQAYDFFIAIFSLLEEISRIEDIESEDCYEVQYFFSMLEVADKKETTILLRKFIDYHLGFIVAYLPTKPRKFNNLVKTNPVFETIFDVIEGREEEFLNTFSRRTLELEQLCKDRYGDTQEISSIMFIWLWTAVLNGREKIIDRLIEYNVAFNTRKLKFPSNVRSTETCQYLGRKLLEHGHDIGKDELPKTWFPPLKFQDFLNSRISYQNTEYVELDCNFLLHQQTTKQLNCENYDDTNNIFREDIRSLRYIINDERLNYLLSHPVLSTYVEIKVLKYQNLFMIYFWLFVAMFAVPIVMNILSDEGKIFFGIVLMISIIIREIYRNLSLLLFSDWSFKMYIANTATKLKFGLVILLCCTLILSYYIWFYVVISTIYLISQIISKYKYNKGDCKFWNIIWILSVDLLLLLSSIILLYLGNSSIQLKVVTIFLITFRLLTMLPFNSMLLHVTMLKKVIKTSIKFFLTFIIILLAFMVAFCLMFGTNVHEASNSTATTESTASTESFETVTERSTISLNSTETAIQTLFTTIVPTVATKTDVSRSKTIAQILFQILAPTIANKTAPFTNTSDEIANETTVDSFNMNFENYNTSFLKVIMMLSGEYTVEPFRLKGWFQITVFLIFVFSTFILFNLIMGLIFDDVQTLREKARHLTIERNAQKFIKTSGKYDDFSGRRCEDFKSCLKCLINVYPYIHKIDKIFVNLKTRKVSVEVNRQQKPIAHMKISKETMKEILNILKERSSV